MLFLRNKKLYSIFKKINILLQNDDIYKIDQKRAWCLLFDKENGIEPRNARHLRNVGMPWSFNFTYTVWDVQEVNDREQTMTLDLYLKKNWIKPKLVMNLTSVSDGILTSTS